MLTLNQGQNYQGNVLGVPQVGCLSSGSSTSFILEQRVPVSIQMAAGACSCNRRAVSLGQVMHGGVR